MTQQLRHGDSVFCPMCQEPQEGHVEDYVAPDTVGDASEMEHMCDECSAFFTVIRTTPSQFEVFAL